MSPKENEARHGDHSKGDFSGRYYIDSPVAENDEVIFRHP